MNNFRCVNEGVFFPGVPGMFLVLLLLFVGCSDNEKPKGLLGKDEMVQAMTELYLAEQKVSTVGVSRDSTAQIFRVMAPAIFNQVGATDSAFRISFDYYMEHPKIMEEIYTSLIDSLNLREQKMISNELKK